MQNTKLTDAIYYIGADDKTLDLFEGQYIVPNGMAYNSYLIKDDKIAVIDTIDIRATETWFDNLERHLEGKIPDYLIVLHMEPDHAANIEAFLNKYPTTKVVANNKTFVMIGQFFEHLNLQDRTIVVNEGDTLNLGKHTLHFIFAPMIHWPEVMMAYEDKEKILFSADAFGKFGSLDTDEDWTCEARRYYFNIVGKYGAQVQNLLKKAATLNIQKIFPLHGPMLTDNLSYYIGKYNIWSAYEPEDKGVLIAFTSIYGHTKQAAFKLKEMLEAKNIKVAITDLARDDMAEALEDAFRYDRMILASPTYDTGIFPAMENFILHLKGKNYQNRTVGFIENGSWAPMSGKKMRTQMQTCKNIRFLNTMLSIKSALKDADIAVLQAMADELEN
ncbi:MAG: FprA family A-type flavoprotein [Alphaproteobacteria bacterium]